MKVGLSHVTALITAVCKRDLSIQGVCDHTNYGVTE